MDENIFMFVPKYKFLGGYFAPWASVNLANGSLVAELVGTNLSGNGGGEGLADTVVAPFELYYEDQRDSGTSPLFHVRGAGLTLSLFL